MNLKLKISDNGKRLSQLFLIYFWVSSLVDTDAFINVYILVAIVAGVSVFKDSVRDCQLNKISYAVLLLCAVFLSTAVSVSNYPLYANMGIFNLIFAVLAFMGGVSAFWNVLLMLYTFPKDKAIPWQDINDRFSASSIFLIVFVCSAAINLTYLFSSQYPAVSCLDALNQIGQIKNGIYTNHHPYWHTMVIKMCLDVAELIGADINFGVAIYSVCQILLVASCFAYAVVTLYQGGFSCAIVLTSAAIFLFAPYHISYSATIWKDTPFGVVVLVFLVVVYRVLYQIGKNQRLNYIVLFLSALGFGLWRSNGWLALVATFVVFLPFLFRDQKKFFVVIAAAIVLSWAMKGPYLAAIGVKQPDLIESLSIPAQQIARTICDDGDITEAEYESLNKIVDMEEVSELYLDYISDPIKNEVRSKNQPYFEENALDYLKIWIKIGLRNPQSYILAWIDQTKGYWNGGYDYWVTLKGIPNNNLGIQDYNLRNPIQYLFYRYIFDTQEIPSLNPIYSIGLHTWLVVMIFVCAALKRRRLALLCIPVIMLIGTLLVATPVAYEFRYAYAMFTSLPFLFPLATVSEQ